MHYSRLLVAFAAIRMAAPLCAQETSSPAPQESPPAEMRAAANTPAEEVEEIVVTGTRVRTGSLVVPYDVRVVGEDLLRRPGLKSASEALDQVSGAKLNPRQENAIFSDIEVRGLAGNATSGSNVLVLLDGVPQRRLSFGGPYLGALPFEAVSRMELVKGAQASLYGRNAMAGALQLFSDPGGTESRVGVSMAYEGSTEDVRTSLRASGPLGMRGSGRLSLGTYSLAGSFGHTNGWQPQTERQRGDLYFHTDLSLGSTSRVSLFGGFVDGTEEMVAPVFVDAEGNRLPGFERGANISVAGHNALDLQEYRIGGRYTRDWMEALQSNLTVAYWHADTHWDVGRPDDQPATGTIAARMTDRRDMRENSIFTEVDVAGRYGLGPSWKGEVSLGASYDTMTYYMGKRDVTTQNLLAATGKYTTGVPFDLVTMQPVDNSPLVAGPLSERDTSEHNAGVFVRNQLTFAGCVHLSGGVRYDWFERTQENPATGERARHSDGAVSPTVGLNVAVLSRPEHKVNVYGSYGLGFAPVYRAVNNTQFADVDPETSVSAEGGVKALLWNRAVEGSLAFYQLDRRDIVAMNPQTKLQENIGDWRIRGIETDWRAKLGEGASLFASAAWRTPKIVQYGANPALVGNRIPAVSERTWTLGVEGRAAEGINIGAQARHASSFYGNDRNSFKLPARTICDAWLSRDWGRNGRVSLFVRNAFDVEYYTSVFNGVANGSAFEGTPRTVGMMIDRRF